MGSELGVTAESELEIKLDGPGIWWICWTSIWTVLLLCGMGYLMWNRNAQVLRIRGIGLSLTAVVALHLYWISVQLGYVFGAVTPGETEYWIMGTWLPLGIALFHASNSRFLYVAKAQQRYLDRLADIPDTSRRGTGIWGRFKRLDYTAKMVILVCMGMSLQLFLVVLMFLISRKFHSTWGIPGTEVSGTVQERTIQMGRGWEWWPSIVWQFAWAWFFAPYVLWKSRHVSDTHGWRFQTTACALAGLHATPMWLIALYVPAMEPVNVYFIPPQWIAISIWVLEILTVFLPCWEVMQATNLRQETLDSIKQWETKIHASAESHSNASTIVDSLMTGRKSTSGSIKSTDSQESILTMSALEYVLERNPTPLQEFSSLRDFSGENIAFLTCVAEWKASLPEAARGGSKDEATRELVRERFNRALRIYGEFIGIKDAEFPINISSSELKKLETIFEAPARILYGEKRDIDPATPFDEPKRQRKVSDATLSSEMEKKVAPEDRVQFWGEIPDSFDETVFDTSEKHIKYLVLTNTWPKFVKDRRHSLNSEETVESGRSIMQMVRNRFVKT